MMNRLQLDFARKGSDFALALARLGVGSFLIYQSHDNVFSSERMTEFVIFLEANGFGWPELCAPVSVYAQFAAGIAFLLGAFTRLFGLIIVVNFVVAVVMVHIDQDFPLVWPALALVLFGAVFATVGAGEWSLDRWCFRRTAGDPATDRNPHTFPLR